MSDPIRPVLVDPSEPVTEPKTDLSENCSKCRFSRMAGNNVGSFHCRLNAPQSIATLVQVKQGTGLRVDTWWPPVQPTDWCAQFKPLKESMQ